MRAQALSVRRRPASGMGVWRMVARSAAGLRVSLRRRARERRRRRVEDAWLRFEERGYNAPVVPDLRSDMLYWRNRPPPA